MGISTATNHDAFSFYLASRFLAMRVTPHERLLYIFVNVVLAAETQVLKATCKVVPSNEVPIATKKQYQKDLDKFKKKCEKQCPPKDLTCEEWLNCMAKVIP